MDEPGFHHNEDLHVLSCGECKPSSNFLDGFRNLELLVLQHTTVRRLQKGFGGLQIS